MQTSIYMNIQVIYVRESENVAEAEGVRPFAGCEPVGVWILVQALVIAGQSYGWRKTVAPRFVQILC